jgi:hypothetical protein
MARRVRLCENAKPLLVEHASRLVASVEGLTGKKKVKIDQEKKEAFVWLLVRFWML